MKGNKERNTAASVRDRFLALTRQRSEDFQLILTRYGLERLLYRLSQSEYQDCFILKGAMLFTLWDDQAHGSTRDVDFLASSPDVTQWNPGRFEAALPRIPLHSRPNIVRGTEVPGAEQRRTCSALIQMGEGCGSF